MNAALNLRVPYDFKRFIVIAYGKRLGTRLSGRNYGLYFYSLVLIIGVVICDSMSTKHESSAYKNMRYWLLCEGEARYLIKLMASKAS